MNNDMIWDPETMDDSPAIYIDNCEHLPLIVCVINGYPQSGKDTFVKYVEYAATSCVVNPYIINPQNYWKSDVFTRFTDVYNVSSVDPVRAAVSALDIPKNDVEYKAPAYRKLMATIKEAWDETYDGSTTFILNKIDDIIKTFTIDKTKEASSTSSKPSNDPEEASHNKIIFVHIREPKNIEHLFRRIDKRYMNEYSVLYTSIFLSRNEAKEKEQSNTADNNVDQFPYDFKIYNNNSEYELYHAAQWFLHKIIDLATYNYTEIQDHINHHIENKETAYNIIQKIDLD